MQNRKRTGLLIISIAIVLLAIFIILLWKQRPQAPVTETPTPTTTPSLIEADEVTPPLTTPGDKPRNYQSYDVSKEAAYQTGAVDAAKMARLFAERFGSFSNQSNYSNITDLEILMTESMRSWAQNYVADLRNAPYSGEYYGIITESVSVEQVAYNEGAGTASMKVSTKRQETKGSEAGAIYSQVININLVKQGNDWLVDRAEWVK